MATFARNGCSQLSPAERASILSALDEYRNALVIYHRTLNEPLKRDVDCIYSDTEYVTNFSPDEIAKMKDLDGEAAASAKLNETSSCIKQILEELKEELRKQGTFKVLTNEVEKLIAREKEERFIIAESEKLANVAAELQITDDDERIVDEEKQKDIVKKLAEEQRDVEKEKLIADVELKYVTAWEKARYEQNALRGDMEIEKLQGILNDCRVRERNDQRVHDKLTKFLIQQTVSFIEKSKELEKRYVREKEMYEKEIRQLRWEIKSRRKELEQLKGEYRRNQKFIDTYLAEKEALRTEKEQKERARISAIRIQAWWRGVMVRRNLGPYRPEEKRKKRSVKTKK
ncbi:uncharacterized protein LOC143340579 [Colletes latitarsis]|uniref:uncharacterized protein LOC143340579 n=1 Tax=Colletes latitarsis TaxID=2605962 RepID=UPI004034FA06